MRSNDSRGNPSLSLSWSRCSDEIECLAEFTRACALVKSGGDIGRTACNGTPPIVRFGLAEARGDIFRRAASSVVGEDGGEGLVETVL